jgi:beta-glucosidase
LQSLVELRDRMELGLLGRQGELVAAVAATGTPVIVVLISGRPVSMPIEASLASAVVAAWVPGEAGPRAIADVLFGDVDPGGKLPVTVPRHVGQVPLYYAHRPTGGASEWHRDYVDGSHLPLWPFGYGLSYTRFELSGLEVAGSPADTDGEVVVSLDVSNIGDRDG